jgi:nucleotide-binding universal stress UspA family protein
MKTVETVNRIALSNVLFATDFSPFSDAALPYAISIARQYGGKVFATHVVPPSSYNIVPPDTWPMAVEAEGERDQHRIDRLEAILGTVPHDILMKVGDVWQVLSTLVKEENIDLLVIGTHGRTGLSKLMMGSVAEEIFRQAQCPVMTIGPEVPFRDASVVKFKSILFATDFSQASKAGLRYAISLAEESQATISLLHCIEKPAVGSVDLDSNASFVLRELEQLVPKDAEFWCKTKCFVEYGNHAEAIVGFAEKHKVDLIVMGVRAAAGNPEIATHLPKRTAHKVVAHATCPVLTVRG